MTVREGSAFSAWEGIAIAWLNDHECQQEAHYQGRAQGKDPALGSHFCRYPEHQQGSPGGSVVKNLPATAGDTVSIPGSGRPGGGNGNPLQYSCLKIPWTEKPGALWTWLSRRAGGRQSFSKGRQWQRLPEGVSQQDTRPQKEWKFCQAIAVLYYQQQSNDVGGDAIWATSKDVKKVEVLSQSFPTCGNGFTNGLLNASALGMARQGLEQLKLSWFLHHLF